jgi:putative transposase
MTSGLKRYYGRKDLHFLTFSCYHRLPFLLNDGARSLVIHELARARHEYGFLLVGYVVMPEHVHVLIGEPDRGTPSTVMQMLKQRVSHKLRDSHGQVALPSQEGELQQFWQPRFYDFNVFTDKKKNEKLEYMHHNPMLRGLVAHPRDWPWSSWSNYARKGEGLIAVDFI